MVLKDNQKQIDSYMDLTRSQLNGTKKICSLSSSRGVAFVLWLFLLLFGFVCLFCFYISISHLSSFFQYSQFFPQTHLLVLKFSCQM